jgi:hypothetical protein
MHLDNAFDLFELRTREAMIFGQLYLRLQPVLRLSVGTHHMDMRARFLPTEEKEPVIFFS